MNKPHMKCVQNIFCNKLQNYHLECTKTSTKVFRFIGASNQHMRLNIKHESHIDFQDFDPNLKKNQ